MSTDQIYNLDDSVVEYFDFIVKGHKYRFRHMTTEEMEKLKLVEKDSDKMTAYLYQFITKVDEGAPDFSETAKQMITPHWVAFRKMIEAQYNG